MSNTSFTKDLDIKPSNDAASMEDTHNALDAHCLNGVKLYSVLSGIRIGTILISIDVSIIATAIPAISSHFNAATDIGWYGAAYPLTMCALQPLSSKISSIFSLRWSYLVFFGVFLLGSVLCGAATCSTMFIVGRAVAGIGGAGIVSGGLSVIALVTPTAQRPLFTGLVTSLYAVGTVIAPIIGGTFTTNVSWRWCFYINLLTGAVTIGTLLFFFHPPKSTTGGGEYPWNSATIIGLFVGFAVSMLLFILWQLYKGDAALIPLTLLKDRSVALGIIFAFLFMGSFVVPVYNLPEWFQIVEAASPMRSGVMLLPSVCTQVFGVIVSGVAAKHVRYYNPWFFIGSSMLCIACGLYTTLTPFSTSSGKWIEFQILQGLDCGFAAQMALLTIQNVLKTRPSIIPVGISSVLFAQYFGSSVMQTVGASIFHNKLADRLKSTAGLNATGVGILLQAGNLNLKKTAVEAFPWRFLEYLAIAASGLAFVLSTGIKWVNINHTDPKVGAEKQTADDQPEP
ncbi:major facilitator superfamily domain-containing protein [Aspergillus tetrazonus]